MEGRQSERAHPPPQKPPQTAFTKASHSSLHSSTMTWLPSLNTNKGTAWSRAGHQSPELLLTPLPWLDSPTHPPAKLNSGHVANAFIQCTSSRDCFYSCTIKCKIDFLKLTGELIVELNSKKHETFPNLPICTHGLTFKWLYCLRCMNYPLLLPITKKHWCAIQLYLQTQTCHWEGQ